MLSNIILGVIAIIMPLIAIWCFIQGIKFGKTEKVPEIKVKKKPTKRERTEIERNNKILNNIANYDGTSNGQEKIDG